MLVALIGPTCSGKASVAEYLVERHGFRRVYVRGKGCVAHQIESDASPSQLLAKATLSVNTVFDSFEGFLDYATANWRENMVTTDFHNSQEIGVGFDKRPFFLLVGVDAPLLTRWTRFSAKVRKLQPDAQWDLERFVQEDDKALYRDSRSAENSADAAPAAQQQMNRANSETGTTLLASSSDIVAQSSTTQSVLPSGHITSAQPPDSLRGLLSTSTLSIVNDSPTLASLYAKLDTLNLTSMTRLRPTWDLYFLSLCTLASLRSNCMKRRVGAVLVRNNRVLSTGYNGTPRGLPNCADGGCPRCNAAAPGGTALDECLCLHAEENALLECGREKGGAEGTVLYCNTCPCLRCAVKIVQVGVREVVYQLGYSMDDRSRQIFESANVAFRQCHAPS